MKFRHKQLVRHLKTLTVYRITHTPEVCRIEATNEPAYAYQAVYLEFFGWTKTGPLWVRPQTEMEDGRFEAA